MPPLPDAIIAVLLSFAPMFSRPVWCAARVLLVGAVLCHGPRTVAAVLRVMGLGQEKRFERYHRVLSRARWSGLQGAKIVLGLLVPLLPASWPVLVGVDDTIERRKGRKITAKGCYRDPVRSTETHVVTCFGLKWVAMMGLVPLPWSRRPWALPFLTVLAPSQGANEAMGQRHKTTVDWAIQRLKVVSRWLGTRAWVLVGDGGYACVRLAWACVNHRGTLLSRLRLDARLYAFPAPGPPGQRGPKPKKGPRLLPLKSLVEAARQQGQEVEVPWYGGEHKRVWLQSGICLWHTPGEQPIAIRWVLVVDPDGTLRPEAFFSTDVALAPAKIVEWFVLRWNVEVTFEEGRRHLGVETQRQWSDQAIVRSTPALLGLCSLVCVMASRLTAGQVLGVRSTAWYRKKEATFSDVLAFVRRALWVEKYCTKALFRDDHVLLSANDWEVVLDQLASTA
jgi:DDE superfamily endonuclease